LWLGGMLPAQFRLLLLAFAPGVFEEVSV